MTGTSDNAGMLRCTARHFRAATLAMVGAVTVALAVMTACDVPATNVPAGSLGVPSATARVAAAASPTAPAAALSDQSHGFLTLEPSALRAEASSVSLVKEG